MPGGRIWIGTLAAVLCAASSVFAADDARLGESIETLRAVAAKGEGNVAAGDAWERLAQADARALTTILAGMDEASPLAANWLCTLVDAIAERTLADEGQLPAADLEKFVLENSHSPRARRLAYEWLARIDPAAPDRLIPRMLNDSSLEMRRDAVARVLEEAAAAEGSAAIAAYEKALVAARDQDQIKICTDALEKLKHPVDIARQLGLVIGWKVIGPFDNTGSKSFDVVYPPEKELDFAGVYQGKSGEVKWIDHETADPYGLVDLTKALDKHKGAIAYAAAEFVSDRAQEVEVRLTSFNANKMWVNGALVGANEVYHSGSKFDQYVGTARLSPGRNSILVKICQNEMEDSWAQFWQFQLRVTDELGGAILSTARVSSGSDSGAK